MNKENPVRNPKKPTKEVIVSRPRLRISSDTDRIPEYYKKYLKPAQARPALIDIINSNTVRRFSTSIQTNEHLQVTEDHRANQNKPFCGASKVRSKSANFDTKFVTIRENVTPKIDDDLFDEVFVDGEDYFNGTENTFEFRKISPVKPNVFTSRSTVLIPGLREKLAQKSTLVNKKKGRKGETGNINDILYEEEYLEEYVAESLKVDTRYVIKNVSCVIINETALDRACVLDWLLKVQAYNLIPASIYLKAVRLFDLVLNATEVSVNMYQLVSMASIWIMNKYESSNIYIPVKRLISLSGNAYGTSQLYKMEQKLLKFLDFRCDIPEPTVFVEYFFCKTKVENSEIRHASYYILESFSLSPYFSLIPSSLLGASVFHLCLEVFDEDTNVWEAVRQSSAYFTPEAMVTTKGFVMRQLMRVSEQHFIYKEYNVQKKFFVSKILQEKFKKRQETL